MTDPPEHADDCPPGGARDLIPVTPAALGLGPLFNQTSDAIVVADVETDSIVLWNAAAVRLFGYTADEVLGRRVELITPERFRPMHRAGMVRFRETGHGRLIDSHAAFELPALTASGEELPIEMSLSQLVNPLTGRRYAMSMIRNIAARKRLERQLVEVNEELTAQSETLRLANQALTQRAEELRGVNEALGARSRELEEQKALVDRIVDNAPIPIAYLDDGLVVRRANPSYARLAGRPLARLRDRPVFDGATDAAYGAIRDQLAQVLETGELQLLSGLRLPAAPPARPRPSHWDFTCAPLRGRQGGLLLLGVDVSDRIEKEEIQADRIDALEQADALKEQFLSILSHELRTPLNSVLGFASVLDDEIVGPLTPEQHLYLGKMQNSTEILLSLINDLLDMSRIQAGKFSLSPAPMALLPVASEVVDSLQDLAERRDQTLVSTVPATLPCVLGDRQRVFQVLVNFVNNAIKFSLAGKPIAIDAGLVGDRVRCTVTDQGIGIAPEDLPKLFQRFSQLDTGNTRSATGTGLGLSISKALVEAMGGTVGVESTLGHGSTFWFELPLAAGPGAR